MFNSSIPHPAVFLVHRGENTRAMPRLWTEVGVDVEPLTPEEGRKRFPVFRFENAAGVLHDRTAGLVAAAQAVQSLIRLIRSRGWGYPRKYDCAAR